ncbi:MAG: hypothetical protein C4523_09580 [Myxococcales bacterium]|nr:MAG: hypothetical protein C4523_09580 [Myxococcales bacterium]
MLAMWSLLFVGCEEKVSKPKTLDPLEARTYEYLTLIKAKSWDAAYAMLSAETQKYYPKEKFVEDATGFILPKVDALYVTKIEKHKLDALVFTEFKPKTEWATYNTMEEAKVKLNYLYKDGKWLVHYPDIVTQGAEDEEKEKVRLARVAEWKPNLLFHDFKVENKITDEGPMLVFNGEVENTSDKPVEMVMAMVDFFDANNQKIYNVVVVPVYISAWEKKTALGPKSKTPFIQSISSEIPDSWSGKFEYYLFDAGDMPQAQ